MRDSQYLEAYLDESASRIRAGEKPRTPGAFLSARLKGRAKNYIMHYQRALINSCVRVGAVTVESKLGGKAFVRKEVTE